MSDQVSSIPAPQTPRAKPRFIFSDSSSVIDTYEAYAKEGFAHLMSTQAEFPYLQEKKFLSKVDLTKGPILVSVQTILRIMAIDWDSPKREKKEYLYYTTEWEAKDHLNNTIKCSHEAEGKYMQQTKETRTKLNPNGEELVQYIRGPAREVYTVPWNKKAADLILTGEKYFGEDSINITNLTEVQYTVKFPYGNPARTAFEMSDFLDFKYEKLQELSRTVKSPYLADLERRVNPYK
jgi:hypothetical protein